MNKITKQNGTLLVPDKVVIPFIEGDGAVSYTHLMLPTIRLV